MAKAKKAVDNIVEEVKEEVAVVNETANAVDEDKPREKYSWLFGILAFIFFPIGIILHYVFRDTHKDWATFSSKGAGWGICFYIVAAFVTLVVLFIVLYANGCSHFITI